MQTLTGRHLDAMSHIKF